MQQKFLLHRFLSELEWFMLVRQQRHALRINVSINVVNSILVLPKTKKHKLIHMPFEGNVAESNVASSTKGQIFCYAKPREMEGGPKSLWTT